MISGLFWFVNSQVNEKPGLIPVCMIFFWFVSTRTNVSELYFVHEFDDSTMKQLVMISVINCWYHLYIYLCDVCS